MTHSYVSFSNLFSFLRLNKPLGIASLLLCSLLLGLAVPSFAADVNENADKPAIINDFVDINNASAELIAATLKGVGLKKAQSIVQWRELNGRFMDVEQLIEVKGIGAKTLELNRAKITL